MIKLTELAPEYRSNFYKWLNDEEAIKYSLTAFQRMNREEEINAWYASLDTNGCMNRAIIEEETGQCIGYAGISNISETNQSGEYFIFIGEKSSWGKGIGAEVTRQIVELGFRELDLNRIMLTVSDLNVGGVKAYERAGFRGEGILRQACFRDGEFHNKIVMSILRKEWEVYQQEMEL